MNPATLLVIFAAGLLAWVWVRNQPSAQRRAAVTKLALFGGALILIVLAATGRLHILGAALAMLLPFVRRLWPMLLGLFIRKQQQKRDRSSGQASGGQSRVSSAIIDMVLEHDTGLMFGTIRQGEFAGKELAELSDEQFITLLQYCRKYDEDSTRLLEAYLDKRFGDRWRQDDPGANTQDETSRDTRNSSDMTRAEAYDILGLEPGASRDEIVQAHRRLMQKMHPDRGGSAYLAARINAARTLLLDH
ncbi:DnaJ domain-containing protein [Salinispirillum marinum]|uniref:DnaJ domain-containing protein n=2 Tax=Saccharospirillaceae TaxID=255527 RepID=A0ABV8BI34_9GAMM